MWAIHKARDQAEEMDATAGTVNILETIIGATASFNKRKR